LGPVAGSKGNLGTMAHLSIRASRLLISDMNDTAGTDRTGRCSGGFAVTGNRAVPTA